MKKTAPTTSSDAGIISMPTDRRAGIDSVIATNGDTPAASAEGADRSEAGEARDGDAAAPSAAVTTAASLDTSPAADIAPATEFEPSGAPVQSSGFDLDHASLDTNPRANTTEDQNRIDFNDPVRPGHEIVGQRLSAA